MDFASVDANIYKYTYSLYFKIISMRICDKIICDRVNVIIMTTGSLFIKFMLKIQAITN